MMKFDPGVTYGHLIEDMDGAPLPDELQRGGRISNAVSDGISRAVIDAQRDHFDVQGLRDQLLRELTPILWPLLPSNDERDLSDLGVYQLREAGYRVLDDDQCCELGCSGGACESCPCCAAGWCVWGHDGEIPDDEESYKIWLEVAAEHNPVARMLAEDEKVLSIIEEAIPEMEADIPEDAGNATSHLIARRLREALARGGK